MPDGERLFKLIAARESDFIDDLAALVALDSYSFDGDDVNRVVDWLAARLRASGFSIEREAHAGRGDDLLAARRGTGRGRIVLLGHSDTVYPRGTAAVRPLTYDGDRILGPGVCDMKGGLLTGIYALEALAALGWQQYGQIDYLCVSDEEIDQRHSIDLIRRVARGADAVLTLEAARENGDIVIARKGVCWLTLTVQGRAAHAGVEPEKGRSAVLALARMIVAIDALNDPARGITLNTGVIGGGRLPSIIAERALAKVDVRAYTRADLDAAMQAVGDACAASAPDGIHFEIAAEEVSPPMPPTPAALRLAELAERSAEALGFTVRGAHTGGAADSAFAADVGAPTLDGLGPVGGLDHSPDEYILRSSIVPRTALLAHLMMRIVDLKSA